MTTNFQKIMRSKIPFQRSLSLFFRGLFIYLFYSGIKHWLYLAEYLPLNDQIFSELSMSLKALVIFLAVADIFAAVGVWLQAIWGVVIWVFRTVLIIFWPFLIDSTFQLSFMAISIYIISIIMFIILKYNAVAEIQTTVKRGLEES